MTMVGIDASSITNSIIGDAQYLRSVIDWASNRSRVYTQNLSTSVMSGAGMSTDDQATITAFMNNLAGFISLANGTIPASATSMLDNVNTILGLS